jgi:hypothetical protein
MFLQIEDGDQFYDIQTNFREWNIVQDIQPSNYVAFRMGNTWFSEMQHNGAFWAKMNVSSNLKQWWIDSKPMKYRLIPRVKRFPGHSAF